MLTPFFSAPSIKPASPWSAKNLFRLSCANVNAPPTYASKLSVKSSLVSSKNGFLLECLILYIASFSFRPLKLPCAFISAKAFSRDAFEVSLGNASSIAFSLVERTLEMTVCRFSGRLARSATARLPCFGEERTRAIPVP
jgi:hypothetical protein